MTTRRHFCRALFALALTLSATAATAQHDHDKESAIDKLATPQPTDDKTKIEVIEFFWYGCPHCNQIEPAVEAWEKTLPKDVVFRREHILWESRRETRGHARLFATLRAMGILAQHQRAAFDSVHAKKLKLHEGRDGERLIAAAAVFRGTGVHVVPCYRVDLDHSTPCSHSRVKHRERDPSLHPCGPGRYGHHRITADRLRMK